MRKLSVKDFIVHNNPCFSCGHNISIRLGSTKTISETETAYLQVTVTQDCVDIDLQITYHDALKLKIFHKTNKIETSNIRLLTKYVRDHKLFLVSTCTNCKTRIESTFLELNLEKWFAHPITISNELLIVKDKNVSYQISSSFFEEKSLLIVDKINNTNFAPSEYFDLPLLTLFKLKNRERFLNKIKTYILFS